VVVGRLGLGLRRMIGPEFAMICFIVFFVGLVVLIGAIA
jgi:hypothetical protein